MNGWKILTSDLRPPLQGGEPIFDGKYPCQLPTVDCDQSTTECSYGWNFVRDIETGFKIAGLWRTGRPNAVIAVTANGDAVKRGNKCRSSSLNLVRAASPEEIQTALMRFSKCFGDHQQAMADEQWAWWQALQRPYHERDKVIDGLKSAIKARELNWTLKEFESARAARDARDALIVSFSARSGWISRKHDLLTVGIRDAYLNGLAIALPTGPDELGFVMEAS